MKSEQTKTEDQDQSTEKMKAADVGKE